MKIGPKTAAALLNEFGSLENILSKADKIKKPTVRESVENSADRLRNNYKLIKLDGCHKLPFAMEELKFTDKCLTTTQILRAIGLRQ